MNFCLETSLIIHVLIIAAPYEFLYDITYLMKKESKSQFRQAVIERFWIRLAQLASNDSGMAQQLSSFQNSNVWYTLPESVRSGIPVFILNSSIFLDSCKLVLTPRYVTLNTEDCVSYNFIFLATCLAQNLSPSGSQSAKWRRTAGGNGSIAKNCL